MMIQVFRMMFDTLTRVLATTCAGRKNYSWNSQKEFMEVSLGDSSKPPVEGKGKIKIYQKDGKPEYIFDVYYIPNMNNNILSIGQLLEKEYKVQMENNIFGWKMQKEAS